MPRLPKSQVKYTPKAMNPNERCKLCTHFYVPPVTDSYEAGRCTQVEGEINSNGWCELFKAMK